MVDTPSQFHAFICCSQADLTWGRWLQQQLRRYKVPKTLIGKAGRDGVLGKAVGDIFLDTQEQSTTTNIGAHQRFKLANSAYLLVICSPSAANSQWINEQIIEFKRQGKENRILCFIVDGEPNAADNPAIAETECFPHSIKFCIDSDGQLSANRTEPIAADAREGKDGKANATLKLLAGILGVNYNDLRQREVVRAKRRMQMLVTLGCCFSIAIAAVWYRGNLAAQKEAEIQLVQQVKQFFTAATTAMGAQQWDEAVANWLTLTDHLLFTLLTAAEQRQLTMALYYALSQQPVVAQLRGNRSDIIALDISPDGKLIATSDATGNIRLYRTSDWQLLHQFTDENARLVWFSSDSKVLVSEPHPDKVDIADTSKAQVKLFDTITYAQQALDVSVQRKSWLSDSNETIFAEVVSGNVNQIAQRDYIVLQQRHEDLLKLVKISDLSRISLPILSDDSLFLAMVNPVERVVDIFYSKAGLARYSLDTGEQLALNPTCHHRYSQPPIQLNGQPWVLTRQEQNSFTLCNLQDPSLNQPINSTKYDLITASNDGTQLYFYSTSYGTDVDVWDISTQQFVVDAKENVKQRLIDLRQLRFSQQEKYGTFPRDLAPQKYFAKVQGNTVDIATYAPEPVPLKPLSPFGRLWNAHHGWYEHRVMVDEHPRAQILNQNKQSGWFDLDPTRPLNLLTTNSSDLITILIQQQPPKHEVREGGLFAVALPDTLTLTQFDSGAVLFQKEILEWALTPDRDMLMYADLQGKLYQLDLSQSSPQPKLLSGITANYQHFTRILGGIDSENMLFINEDFEVKVMPLRAGDSSTSFTIQIRNEAERSALELTSATEAILQHRYLLVDFGQRQSVIDLSTLKQTDLSLEDGAEYLFDTPEQTLYFNMPGRRILAYSLKNQSSQSFTGLPSWFKSGLQSTSVEPLAPDMTLFRYFEQHALLYQGQFIRELPQCNDGEIEGSAFEPTQRLLATVSSGALCLLDATTLQTVLKLSREELRLNNSFEAVFFHATDEVSVVLDDGNILSLPISIELPDLITLAQQRRRSAVMLMEPK